MNRIISIAGVVCAGVFVAAALGVGMLASVGTVAGQSGGADAGGRTGGYVEAEAQAIDRMLMCPVCPAESIDQAQVPLARQMRAQVRQLLSEGASRDDVLAWFRNRYGPGIVAEPPRSGFNLIAWIVPAVAVVGGLAGGLIALRAMRRDTDLSGVAVSGDDDLQPYLAAVDRDIANDSDCSQEGNNG